MSDKKFNPCINHCYIKNGKQFNLAQCYGKCDYADICKETDGLRRFKKYFEDLYGEGLEIANYHMNGDTEPFDNFYDSAIQCME